MTDEDFRPLRIYPGVGTGAGYALDDMDKQIPVVHLYFPTDDAVFEDGEPDEDFDPDDGRWLTYTLGIRCARQLMSDLAEMVDMALQGPPEE